MNIPMNFLDLHLCNELNNNFKLYQNYMLNYYRFDKHDITLSDANNYCCVLKSKLQSIVDKYIPENFKLKEWTIDFREGVLRLYAAD